VEAFDAVILAAGRLDADAAQRAGHSVKGVVRIGETTPLAAMLAALGRTPAITRTIVVGPDLRDAVAGAYDDWLDERASAEENALAGLRAARTRRVLLCASDVPFVTAAHVEDFLSRVPADADIAYPIFERDRFLQAYPGGRSKFARIGAKRWTGGSVCVIARDVALENERLIARAFRARRSQIAMASLFGLGVLVRHLAGTLEVEHVVARIRRLSGAKAVTIAGAHPALALDCDSLADIEYARVRAQRVRPDA
jgi:hypothetical protein